MIVEILSLTLGVLILNTALCFTLLFLYFYMVKKIKKYIRRPNVTERPIARNPPSYDEITLIRTPTSMI